ncbi:hypothetical protein PIB30_041227 [Stylosanthes scabra]|uniref:Uncharacterized protein n=1 Tax=Stylosanthes scabra TaxID=79078 RepID=A0ABU6SFW7_9FABA|nr:hypothetical protein [Stylosanthes scabra]
MQNTILQKLGVADSKRVAKLFYRAHVAVVSEHVNYGSFVVQRNADLEGSSAAHVALVVSVIPPYVASPSSAADLHREDNDGCDLGDNRTFGEL